MHSRKDAAHRALRRLQEIGIDKLVDDSIKPRAVPNGRDQRLKARIDESDPGILRPRDWPHNTVIHIRRLYGKCQQPDVVKSLLLHHSRIRQNNPKLPANVRLIREVHQIDLEAALNDVSSVSMSGGKRKIRADSPFSGQVDEEENDRPTKKQQRCQPDRLSLQNKTRPCLNDLQRPSNSSIQAHVPSSSRKIAVTRRSKGKAREAALVQVPRINQNQPEPESQFDRKAEKTEEGHTQLKTASQSQSSHLQIAEGHVSSSEINLPTIAGNTPTRTPLGDHQALSDQLARKSAGQASSADGQDSTEAHVGASSLEPRIPPGFELIEVFDHPNTDQVLMTMLSIDLARLEKINHDIGPKQDADASEASTFAPHMVAAVFMGDASRSLEGEASQEFMELFKLRMEDERTHMSHQRAVLETSLVKLRAYIEQRTELQLNESIKERIDKVLS